MTAPAAAPPRGTPPSGAAASPAERSPAFRLGVFAAGLAVLFAAAFGVGRVTGDLAAPGQDAVVTAADHGGGHDETVPAAAGTSLSEGGLRLEVPVRTLPAGTAVPFAFRVLDPSGAPLTSYDVEAERELHLVVVGRDLQRYAHLHPERTADGTWTVPLTLAPGSYRAVAAFETGGERYALAADLTVPGQIAAAPLPPPATTAEVGSLLVELERDGSRLSFTAYDDAGRPVVPEPYLGARGHLVAFRAGDLAYVHVHPAGEQGATTAYETELPGPGTYRLFLELQVDGEVRTASYTLEVTA